MNSEINLKFEIDKTTLRLLAILVALVAIIAIGSRTTHAQEVTDTIRVDTRVVFMDALVKDKRTGVPIADLKPENFEIFDDGSPRAVSYFTREGQARKPLALVLILDLREDGAGRFLKRPEILKAMGDELAKLSPEDEVAIMVMNIKGENEKRVWLTSFTRDHAQLVAALARAPEFVDVDPDIDFDVEVSDKDSAKSNKTDGLKTSTGQTSAAAGRETSAASRETSAAGPETTAASPETTAASRETSAASRETTAAGPETTAAGPETTAASPETTAASRETSAASRETTAAGPETTAASPETTAASRETSAASRETTAAGPETTAAGPETTAASPETTAASRETSAASRETTAAGPETTAASRETTAAGRETTAASPETSAKSTDSLVRPSQNGSAGPGAGTPRSDENVQVEVIKGKNGAVVTRTTKPDGSVDVKRANKKGDVTVEVNDIYDMAAAVRDTTRKAQAERPNSQTAIVWVSDGIAPIFFEDRDATEQLIIRSGVTFNSLTVELRTLFKMLMPIGRPVAGMLGVSLYGSAKRLAQQSGGEAVKVKRTKDYAAGLAKIIGNLTARYSLGFSLAEDEKDDGRLHNLEVRVKAPDAKGKLRKLEVSSRRGYYMSETGPKTTNETTAAKTP